MMENEIRFKLLTVKTDQYATFEENFTKGEDIKLGTGFEFKMNIVKKQVGTFATFSFEQNKEVFLKLQISCHFEIEPESWNECSTDSKVILPKKFLAHLAMLSVGTARGVLHAKTENTIFNKFCLPLIDVSNLITDDAEFPLT